VISSRVLHDGKGLSTGANDPAKQNTNPTSFWKFGMHMFYSEKNLYILNHFSSISGSCRLSSLQHSNMHLFTGTCSSKRESLLSTCLPNLLLIFSAYWGTWREARIISIVTSIKGEVSHLLKHHHTDPDMICIFRKNHFFHYETFSHYVFHLLSPTVLKDPLLGMRWNCFLFT